MLLYDGFGCHAADAVCNLSQIARGDIQEVGIIGHIAPLLEVGGYGLGEMWMRRYSDAFCMASFIELPCER